MEADEFVVRILTVNGRDLTRINVARCQGRGGRGSGVSLLRGGFLSGVEKWEEKCGKNG